MKKVLIGLLALVMVLGLVGCGSNMEEVELTSENFEEVELTSENFRDYFVVDYKVENKKHEEVIPGKLWNNGTADVVVMIDKKVECELKDVSFSIALETLDSESSLFGISWPDVGTVDSVTLPVNGNFEGNYSVKSAEDATFYSAEGNGPFYDIVIDDISGSVLVEKSNK